MTDLREKAREMACRIPDDQPGTPVSARCEHQMRLAMAEALRFAADEFARRSSDLSDEQADEGRLDELGISERWLRAEAKRLMEVKP